MIVTVDGNVTFFKAIHLLKQLDGIAVIPSPIVASTKASHELNNPDAKPIS